MTTDRDPVVARALARLPVPPHAPDFWDEVVRRLASPTDVDASVVTASRGRLRPAHLVAVAALVMAVVAAAALVARQDTAAPPPADDTTTTSTSTSTSVPVRSAPGSAEAVLAFLDALGTGDIDAAAALVGPRSEAALEGAGTSVERLLREAEEGFGAWAHATDRDTRVVELRPGEVVVVVSGTVRVEGTVEQRADAFPARYAESARVWFVERWAYDPKGGIPVTFEVAGGRVEAQVPGDGTAWLSVDGGPPDDTTVPAGQTASWELPAGHKPGPHLYVVAFVSESTFAAAAKVT